MERVCAIALHISLSIIVLYAIKGKQTKYLIYVIVPYALFDIPAGLYQAGFLSNVFVVEMIIVLFAIIAVIYVVRSRRIWEIKK